MQVMHDDDNNIIICNQSSGFFIIMSPAEGLHFSALVKVVVLASSGYKAKTAVTCILKLIFIYNYADNMTDVSMLNEKFLRISEQLDAVADPEVVRWVRTNYPSTKLILYI